MPQDPQAVPGPVRARPATSDASRPPVTFGEFRLDAANATLKRGDTPVPLTPKAFGVLELLVSRAGQLVTKDEFLDRLWPGVFVGDAVLKVCIREIRQALGDDHQAPRFIETAHKRGYRFIAPVSAGAAAPPLVEAADFTPPQTRYARSGNVNIAYQVVGDGPIDLVFVMGWVSHLDYFWAEPSFARFLRRLASFSRLILFDKRGTGLSDRVGELPTLEQRMDDVRAVLDAVGSRQAALLGVSEGGPLCALYATTYPERTRALVMIGTYAKRRWAPDYPWAPTDEQGERFLDEIQRTWGGPVGLEARAPSVAHDPAFRDWWSTYLRMGASPGAALALTRMNAAIDVRDVLPAIRVPTLIVHRTEDRLLTIDEGRYVASLIPGATLLELPGEDHLPFVGNQDAILDGIEGFLAHGHDAVDADRVLATIVTAAIDPAPTEPAARQAFEAHARADIDRHRGRLLAFSSSQIQAAFDGPARAIRCAATLVAAGARSDRAVRAGLHTGECEIVAGEMRGVAVGLSSDLVAMARTGEVLVSRTLVDLVAGSGLEFESRGPQPFGANGDRFEVFAVRPPAA
jgi:pimeloyl-ACP methyl ester carboxylesterase/DNA-binding winged helix-turn-helix (wHTH) protein